MIHGRYDMVQPSDRLKQFVPNVEVETLQCGHWIQQEKPEETNRADARLAGAQIPAVGRREDRRRPCAAPPSNQTSIMIAPTIEPMISVAVASTEMSTPGPRLSGLPMYRLK